MADTEKNWWAPVWRGLVVEPEGKHFRRMKEAVWLFLYLILHADRPTGTLRRKLTTIGRDMGVPRRTIQRWLRRLRQGGYITTRETGRAVQIAILKWKTLPVTTRVAHLGGQIWRPRVAKNGAPRPFRNGETR